MEANLISVDDFCIHYKVEINFIKSLEEFGLIKTKAIKKSIFINADDLSGLERYLRLYKELEINLEGLHAVGHLLKQLDFLQNKVKALNNEISYYKQLH
ncbi:chaperone modulator CbpM [Pedobacter aquatilis]|uniref:chaperone modulator CbpM n=1 Tax=Pedobacter aquatilis TaxID=351343 RepID=UPI00292D69EF|nr:chaperone modulator CbpM [Pedobacter aquatilis]